MAASLPDRYGKTASEENHVVTNNFLVSIGIIIGACGVAVMASSIVVKTANFYEFANYALEILNQTQFVVYVGYGSLVLGFVGILIGFFVALSGLLVAKHPHLTYFSLFLLLLSGGGNIAAGVIVQSGVSLIDNAIYGSPAASPTKAPTVSPDIDPNLSFTQEVTHFQIAMFNTCCASKGLAYSKEIYAGVSGIPESVDLSGYVKSCPTLYPTNLADIRKSTSVRSCYEYQRTYLKYNFTVSLNSVRLCKTLTEAQVNVAGKTIPGTSIDVTSQTNNDPIIPIVGPLAAPDFGCGIGYAKAFQAAMLIWAENIISPVGTAFIACGAVYIVLFLLAMVSFYACSKGSTETAEERYARYLEEINSSSQAAKGQVTDAFEEPNPRMSAGNPHVSVTQAMQPVGTNRTSLQNPNRMSVQSYNTQGSNNFVVLQSQPVPELNFNVDDKI